MLRPQKLMLSADAMAEAPAGDLKGLLRREFKNLITWINPARGYFKILGPAMPYLELDPQLEHHAGHFIDHYSVENIAQYHRRSGNICWCFEDSWSAFFILEQFCNLNPGPLAILHVDDHTDMMPAPVSARPDGLVNVPLQARMHRDDPDTIAYAIDSGAIGIGNFMTFLYAAFDALHVRHLGNQPPITDGPRGVTIEACTMSAAQDIDGIKLRQHSDPTVTTGGTFYQHRSAARLLETLPSHMPLVVHIDLDYFMNFFDAGNRAPPSDMEEAEIAQAAETKIESLFAALQAHQSDVALWIIAFSPGFCPAHHWRRLNDEIVARIEALTAAAAGSTCGQGASQ